MGTDLGDYQTPPELVRAVLDCIGLRGRWFARVLEPTCGIGNFIAGLLAQSDPPREIIGFELQRAHLERARDLEAQCTHTRLDLRLDDIFQLDLRRDLSWQGSGDLLVVGNPPWITNAALSALSSNNRPQRKNRDRIRGIEAMTGQSNFDLAEAVWIKLLEELAPDRPTIALLCKTSVARRVLKYAEAHRLGLGRATLHLVDGRRWFGAGASACLFILDLVGWDGKNDYQVEIYPSLETPLPVTRMGMVDGRLAADLDLYGETAFLDGTCPLAWRQGIKHDAAPILELTEDDSGHLANRAGLPVDVEPEVLYPLLKSSDLFHGRQDRPRRWAIVTQTRMGQDTSHLKQTAPKLWDYLSLHRQLLDRRRSSIYRGRPPFALFGIGDYTFSPYKVAVSGLHKAPIFRLVSPWRGLPVVVDDTCYFIPCSTQGEAALLAGLLNHPLCRRFLGSLMFSDAKRPVTKQLLQRIDLSALCRHLGPQVAHRQAMAEIRGRSPEETTWPESIDRAISALFEAAPRDAP